MHRGSAWWLQTGERPPGTVENPHLKLQAGSRESKLQMKSTPRRILHPSWSQLLTLLIH